MAFSPFVSTRRGPIKPIVPFSRTVRPKEPPSTYYSSNLTKSSTTSTCIQISYSPGASKKRLRSYVSVSTKWVSTGITIQSTSSSVPGMQQQHSDSYSSVTAETKFAEFKAPSSYSSRASDTSSKMTWSDPAQRGFANESTSNPQTLVPSKTCRKRNDRNIRAKLSRTFFINPVPRVTSRQRFLQHCYTHYEKSRATPKRLLILQAVPHSSRKRYFRTWIRAGLIADMRLPLEQQS